MPAATDFDAVLIERVRASDTQAWEELIARFEGRLLAFVESRLRNRAASEDVVQEAFIGFLTSLPNYDGGRPLESYLFSIAAHKLTDHLRREGRRPALPLSQADNSRGASDLPGSARRASTMLRSGERRGLEEESLARALDEQLARWRERGEWQKIQCIELLFVRGVPNKHVAEALKISEQTVANHKFDFLARLRTTVRKQGLPQDVFPELHASD
ncbi:MAG: sigma-70 family RNA polymerase sigma factor [Planctomycetaceae bacterium]|nr:sigma-70 family RNA polymerase sigma factor [Planctomycetaceae bacterium]